MSQSAPASRQELKDFCLRQLGYPVITINVDDVQVEDAVNLAFQYWNEFHFDGTERTYVKYQMTQTDINNRYVTVPDNVVGITNIFPVGGTNQSMTFFDLRYQLRLNDLWDLSSTSYVNYALTMQHMRTLDMIFSGEQPVRFNRVTNIVYIDWDWTADIYEGQWIVMEGYVITDPDAYTKAYNDRMLKKLAVAYVKKQWGNNLKKFAGMQLPGGITMNGQQIFEEAVAEIKEIEEYIENTYQAPPQFLVG
jgi:hypothetical protein